MSVIDTLCILLKKYMNMHYNGNILPNQLFDVTKKKVIDFA